ncbi:MAG: AMP-binding protein [Alphaproteobacteria bacterium]|nr:AMP-binding protein [Alphaproteobacteria bacterium]
MRLPHPLAASARGAPEVLAVHGDVEALSYRALQTRVQALAGGLAEAGLRPGQRVALLGPTSTDWVLHFWAAHWLGASVVPLSSRASAPELQTALEASAPAALLALDEAPAWDGPRLEPGRLGAPLPERDQALDEERLVVLSSGSTGAPRPISLSAGQLLFSAMGSALRLGHLPGDRWLGCLPLHHVGGLSVLLRCALYGTTAELHARFDPSRVAARLDSGELQGVSLVPAMLRQVLDAREERPFPPALRVLLIGGARTPRSLLGRARRLGAPLALTWGMTETASQVSTRAPGDLDFGEHSGAPLPFARVRPDADGRLWVEGPVAPGGAVASGDLGTLDEAGRVRVSGRADDVILSGGENIDPAEIVAALLAHPGVAEAAVLARPDPRWGQRPVAAYVPHAEPIPEAELRDWVRGRLSAFKCPDRFVALPALPRTALGKLARGRLRELLGLS